jgi:membrane-associated phospholipid phosphatase
MDWYQYVGCFFSGAFSANTVPHFVAGISGNKFPTPFAKPRGVGLSSSTTNMIWSLFNMLVGFLLFRSCVNVENNLPLLLFFAGIAFAGIGLSRRFMGKHKE